MARRLQFPESSKEDYRRLNIKRCKRSSKAAQNLIDQRDESGDAAPPAKNSISNAPPSCVTKVKIARTTLRNGELETHAQPEVFYIDPKRGLADSAKSSASPKHPESSGGVSISLTWRGQRDRRAPSSSSSTGLPFQTRLPALQKSTTSKAVDDSEYL